MKNDGENRLDWYDKANNVIAATLGSLIVGGAIFTGAREYGDHRAAEAVRNAPADVLAGNVDTPPIVPDKLAEILVKDPAARNRWVEIKQTMEAIEEKAAALESGAGPAAPSANRWRGRIGSQPAAKGDRTPGVGE